MGNTRAHNLLEKTTRMNRIKNRKNYDRWQKVFVHMYDVAGRSCNTQNISPIGFGSPWEWRQAWGPRSCIGEEWSQCTRVGTYARYIFLYFVLFQCLEASEAPPGLWSRHIDGFWSWNSQSASNLLPPAYNHQHRRWQSSMHCHSNEKTLPGQLHTSRNSSSAPKCRLTSDTSNGCFASGHRGFLEGDRPCWRSQELGIQEAASCRYSPARWVLCLSMLTPKQSCGQTSSNQSVLTMGMSNNSWRTYAQRKRS